MAKEHPTTIRRYKWLTMMAALIGTLVLASCGGGGGGTATSPPPTSTSTLTNASASVGVAGGAVQTANAVIRVDIPANALSTTQQITIATAATDTPPGNVGNVFLNLGPDGTTFSKAVKIQVKYDPQSLSPSMSEGDLTLAYSDANQWNNIPTVVDTVNKTLTAETTHFSTYGVTLATSTKKPYGTLLGKVNGVEVYSNGCLDPSTAECGGHPDTYNTNNAGGYNTGLMWQCVELVNRYFLQQYGLQIRVAGESANQYYKNASARGLLRYSNGGAEGPRVGDILVSEVGKYGHVAIVSKVTSNTVYYAQQNFNEGPADLESTIKLTQQGGNYTLDNFSPSYPIVGWVRAPTSTSDAPTAQVTHITPENGSGHVILDQNFGGATVNFQLAVTNATSSDASKLSFLCNGRVISFTTFSNFQLNPTTLANDGKYMNVQVTPLLSTAIHDGDTCTVSGDIATTGTNGTVKTAVSTTFSVVAPRATPTCIAPQFLSENSVCVYPIGVKAIGTIQLPVECFLAFVSAGCFKDTVQFTVDAVKFVATGVMVSSRPTMVAFYKQDYGVGTQPQWGVALAYADSNALLVNTHNNILMAISVEIDWVMGTANGIVFHEKATGQCHAAVWDGAAENWVVTNAACPI